MKGWLGAAAQFVATMAILIPAGAWTYTKLDAKAQEYVNEAVKPSLDGLAAGQAQFATEQAQLVEQVEHLTKSINALIRGQSAETSQSTKEAAVARQILCLQKLQIEPEAGSIEECEALE